MNIRLTVQNVFIDDPFISTILMEMAVEHGLTDLRITTVRNWIIFGKKGLVSILATDPTGGSAMLEFYKDFIHYEISNEYTFAIIE